LDLPEEHHEYIIESFGNFLRAETTDEAETINAIWKDWRLQRDQSDEDVDASDKSSYVMKLEHHTSYNQIWFSILQGNLVEVSKGSGEITPTGLCGLIEIRDGKPAISLGFDENQNVIHITSNTHNELAITSDHSGISASYGETVRFAENHTELGLNRTAVASEAFGEHDFSPLDVNDSDNWTCDGMNTWIKNVELIDVDGNTAHGTYTLEFADDLCHVISTKFTLTDELRKKIANNLMTDADFEPRQVTEIGSWESDGKEFKMTIHLEDDNCIKSTESFWVHFNGNWSDDYTVSHK
jgi:hypothetical protein